MAASHDGPAGKPSRLADARSAYLRSAAAQAIDWHPWGEEAFARAEKSGRPILLDIGAAWCHWCHVMDEGTYTDDEVARLVRDHFVAVKVDRDENPEVDRRYQRQVSALTGEGGWPLTGFLTPDGEVFLGGTYFPPTDGHGRPGFRRVLREVARLWKEEPEKIRQNTQALRDALGRLEARRSAGRAAVDFVEGVVASLHSGFDPVHGGFGGAPKFPHPTAVELLLWDEYQHERSSSGEKARDTLAAMADGGMYDQVGGGFHRYSVDEGWHVPHFEKMAIDNAELLGAYVSGFQRFRDPRFEEVVRGIVGWFQEVLADPQGGWGASQDADNAPGDDGSYFTWTRAELRGTLDPDAYRLAVRVFGIDTDGRMPHAPERNVLFRLLAPKEAADGLAFDRSPDQVLGEVLTQLRRARARRPAPQIDPALYASVNGRCIASLSRAATVFAEPSWTDAAARAAERFLAGNPDLARGVAHRLDGERVSGFGLLDDQVAFASGLLELAVARADPRYLERALALLRLVDREFRGEDGLFRDIAPSLYDGPKVGDILVPIYSLEDMPHLAANAAAVLGLGRAAALVHDDGLRQEAQALATALAPRLSGAGLFAAGSALATGLLSTEPASVVVDGSGPAAAALLRAAHRTYRPNAATFSGRPPQPFALPVDAPAAGASARALVCFGRSCGPPATSEEQLTGLLRRGASPA